MKQENEVKQVYQAISAITEELAKGGIAKANNNAQQGYKFRGIDDVYNALASLLAKHKLNILPNVLERQVVERVNKNGTVLFYVTVKVDYSFISTEDGSCHNVPVYGEAMDSGDKATNKAMSAAYKYACLQAFCIPTEGDNDADATTHEVTADKPKQKQKLFATAVARNNFTKALIASMEATEELTQLEEVFNQQKDKLIAMREGEEFDVLAYESITKSYKSHKGALAHIASEMAGQNSHMQSLNGGNYAGA